MSYNPPTQQIVDNDTRNTPSNEAIYEALAAKQATLQSGTNIKTINGNSLLGSGNLTVAAGDTVVPVTDQATLTFDASAGNIFTVTIADNRTLGVPTNPTNGKKIIIRVKQDASGNRVLSYDSVWNFGQDLFGISNSLSANAVDYIGAVYNSGSSKWDIIAFSRGY